jgi:gamma-glutamyltranspeptidase/glutathione hydrolase
METPMNRRTVPITLAALSITALVLALGAAPPPVRGRAGIVSADHPLASAAGAQMLERGGNAVDAVVAAALSAGVVQPAGSGLGGGGFAVVVRGDERVVLDFREIAPAAAHRDMYLDDAGNVIPGASTDGGLAVGVPGEPRGLAELLDRFGNLSASAVAKPAIEQASGGFPIGAHLVNCLGRYPEITPRLLDGWSAVPGQAERVRRKRLARTLGAWARSGGDALYTGPIAADIVAATRDSGGVLTAEDLAAYQPVERPPLVGSYRGYTVVTMPPPSSGGAVLLQVLGVLEAWDLAELGHNSSEHLHLLAEAFQHAYADRARLMGDPDFVDVPVDRMLDSARIDEIRRSIYPSRTFERSYYGLDVGIPEDGGTHHIAVIDSDGMAVALTTTINTLFGAKVVAERSGILLNDEMDDFVAKPGVPNAFGLVGREANAVEPGKKPLSSMTPTVVLDPDGAVVMAVGGSGGPYIISSTLQALSNVIDFGMDPEEAVSAPRMHHQWVPEVLRVDQGIPADVQANLIARGHTVEVKEFYSAVQMALVDGDHFTGACDPRKGGEPAAPR